MNFLYNSTWTLLGFYSEWWIWFISGKLSVQGYSSIPRVNTVQVSSGLSLLLCWMLGAWEGLWLGFDTGEEQVSGLQPYLLAPADLYRTPFYFVHDFPAMVPNHQALLSYSVSVFHAPSDSFGSPMLPWALISGGPWTWACCWSRSFYSPAPTGHALLAFSDAGRLPYELFFFWFPWGVRHIFPFSLDPLTLVWVFHCPSSPGVTAQGAMQWYFLP